MDQTAMAHTPAADQRAQVKQKGGWATREWAEEDRSWAEPGKKSAHVHFPFLFYFSFIISVLFPNQKFKLNSNSGFNIQVSNIKPNSNTSTTCTEIIYLLLLFILLPIVYIWKKGMILL
jgi:hypothetical protein